MNKYQTGVNGQRDPSINGINQFENNGLGGTGYRPYLQGGSKFRATGAGPYCAYESRNGADKASECKTVEVCIIQYSHMRSIFITFKPVNRKIVFIFTNYFTGLSSYSSKEL